MPNLHYKIEPRKGKLSLLDKINAVLDRKTGEPEDLNMVFGEEPFEGNISELELIWEQAPKNNTYFVFRQPCLH